MTIPVLVIGAYFFGGVPYGVLAARSKGVDIFTVGSGNPGATNVMRSLGRTWGLLVFFADVLKGLLPALLARYLYPESQVVWAAVGGAAVIGHVASPFLKFRGGKGISTLLGAFFATAPLVTISAFAVFLVLIVSVRLMSLASIIATASALIFGLVYHDIWQMFVVYGLATVLVLIRHKSNIKRLIAGTEPRFEFGKTRQVPPDEPVIHGT